MSYLYAHMHKMAAKEPDTAELNREKQETTKEDTVKEESLPSNCSICLDQFKSPKVLPCCHSFCLHCLERLTKSTTDTLTCPTCKDQHKLPSNGVQGFPDDYTLVDHTPCLSPLTCQQCDDNNTPVAYCNTCSDYLCEECLTAHKQSRMKALRSHKTVTLAQDKVLATQDNSKKVYHCSNHPEELLKLYCRDCKSLACLLCFVGQHNGHNVGSIDSKAREEVEKSIADLAKQTDTTLEIFNDNLKFITAVEKEKSEASNHLKAQVNEKIEKLIKQLETRRKELNKEIDKSFTKDLKSLWADKEFHETVITNMKGALAFAKRSLACQEDVEMLALGTQVSGRLKELSQLKWDSKDMEKMDTTQLEFKEIDHNDIVGDLKPTVRLPVIEITTDQESYQFTNRKRKCAIQVKAVVKQEGKDRPTKLTLSNSNVTFRSWHSVKKDKHEVSKNCEGNSWTVTRTLLSDAQYITNITVWGMYGHNRIEKTIKREINYR